MRAGRSDEFAESCSADRYPVTVGVRSISVSDVHAKSELVEFIKGVEDQHGHALLSDTIRLVLNDENEHIDLTAVALEDSAGIRACALATPANGSRIVEVIIPHDHDLAPQPAVIADLIEAIAAHHSGDVPLVWWCRGHEPWADAVATTSGWSEHRRLFQMRIRFDSPTVERLRQWVVPTRPFSRGRDEDRWLHINNRAFAEHGEQGAWTRSDLDRRIHASWFDATGFLLHPVDGEPEAFCWTKVHVGDSHSPAMGEIYVIAVDPSFSGRGLGRAMTASGLVNLAERGLEIGMLYVDSTNRAAVALYQSLGMVVHHVDRAFLVKSTT